MFVITAERAEAYLRAQAPADPEPPVVETAPPAPVLGVKDGPGVYHIAGGKTHLPPAGQPGHVEQADAPAVQGSAVTVLTWNGDIPAQKWVNFYMKVLTKISSGSNLQLSLRVVATNDQGFSQQKAEEMRAALRELGLDPNITIE
jgi:hypothetical protein